MNNIAKILMNAIKLSDRASAETTTPSDSAEYARAAQHMTQAWAVAKEQELHEKFHLNQPEFSLPGEDPLGN